MCHSWFPGVWENAGRRGTKNPFPYTVPKRGSGAFFVSTDSAPEEIFIGFVRSEVQIFIASKGSADSFPFEKRSFSGNRYGNGAALERWLPIEGVGEGWRGDGRYDYPHPPGLTFAVRA